MRLVARRALAMGRNACRGDLRPLLGMASGATHRRAPCRVGRVAGLAAARVPAFARYQRKALRAVARSARSGRRLVLVGVVAGHAALVAVRFLLGVAGQAGVLLDRRPVGSVAVAALGVGLHPLHLGERRLAGVALHAVRTAGRELVGSMARAAGRVLARGGARQRLGPGHLVALRAGPRKLRAWGVNLVTGAAGAVRRDRDRRRTLRRSGVAARAVAAGAALVQLLLVRLMAQAAREDVAVDHRRRHVACRHHQCEARAAIARWLAAVTGAALGRRRLRELAASRQEIMARQARKILHARFVHLLARVARLATLGPGRQVVRLGTVAGGAAHVLLVVRRVANSPRDLQLASRSRRVARLAARVGDLGVRLVGVLAPSLSRPPLAGVLPEAQLVAAVAGHALVPLRQAHAGVAWPSMARPEAEPRASLHMVMNPPGAAGHDQQHRQPHCQQDARPP